MFRVTLLSNPSATLQGEEGPLEFSINDVRCRLHVASAQTDLGEEKLAAAAQQAGVEIWVGSPVHGEHVLQKLPRLALPDPDAELISQGVSLVRAPMPCKVLKVVANEVGGTVQKGDILLILESMKMEMKVYAETDGVVKEITCQADDVVEEGVPLLMISVE